MVSHSKPSACSMHLIFLAVNLQNPKYLRIQAQNKDSHFWPPLFHTLFYSILNSEILSATADEFTLFDLLLTTYDLGLKSGILNQESGILNL